MHISEADISFFNRAVELACAAEGQGNLPVGAVITLDGQIVATGKNTIWQPRWAPNRHAEIEALRAVPENIWDFAGDMTLYTTLEPCLMCLGTILVYRIGRVLFGARDTWGGASKMAGHMPAAFEEMMAQVEWAGPVYASACDPLFERVMALIGR